MRINPYDIYTTTKNISMTLDHSIKAAVDDGGLGSYFVFFFIIFLGCAFIFLAWLPSDVLIFLCGSLANSGHMNILLVIISGSTAAFLGNQVKYKLAFHHQQRNPNHHVKLNDKWAATYFKRNKDGSVVTGNLIPVVGNLIPMIAGYNQMNFQRFTKDNIKGTFLWIIIFTIMGFISNNIPIIEHNMVISSLIVSLLVGLLYRLIEKIIVKFK